MHDMAKRFEALERRVAEMEGRGRRQERQVRLWRVLATFLGMAVLALPYLPRVQAQGAAIQAAAPFRIVAADGTRLMEVDSTPLGPQLQLFNAKGEPQAQLIATNLGGLLRCRNAGGNTAFSVGATGEGSALHMNNKGGKLMVSLDASDEGGAAAIANPGDHTVVALGAAAGTKGGDVIISNQSGREVVRLGVSQDNSGFARVLDSAGTRIFAQP